jgi:hypothetical protein
LDYGCKDGRCKDGRFGEFCLSTHFMTILNPNSFFQVDSLPLVGGKKDSNSAADTFCQLSMVFDG